jgi:hypothetical protein
VQLPRKRKFGDTSPGDESPYRSLDRYGKIGRSVRKQERKDSARRAKSSKSMKSLRAKLDIETTEVEPVIV